MNDGSEENGDGKVITNFTTGDMLVMIAQLTNAVTYLTTATTALCQGQTEVALIASGEAGTTVDEIMRTLRQKVDESGLRGS